MLDVPDNSNILAPTLLLLVHVPTVFRPFKCDFFEDRNAETLHKHENLYTRECVIHFCGYLNIFSRVIDDLE